MTCLVPVQRFPRSSRSIHFSDVSQENGSLLFLDYVPPNELAARNKRDLGTRQREDVTLLLQHDQNPLELCFLVQIRAFVIMGLPNFTFQRKYEMTTSCKWPI